MLNNQHRLIAVAAKSFYTWQQVKKLWTQGRETASTQAAHDSLDELIKPPQSPDSAKQIPPH
jgi:hypothetical protein